VGVGESLKKVQANVVASAPMRSGGSVRMGGLSAKGKCLRVFNDNEGGHNTTRRVAGRSKKRNA